MQNISYIRRIQDSNSMMLILVILSNIISNDLQRTNIFAEMKENDVFQGDRFIPSSSTMKLLGPLVFPFIVVLIYKYEYHTERYYCKYNRLNFRKS